MLWIRRWSIKHRKKIGSIWSAKEVQQFILDEANNLKCTPNSAYIFAYKRMTKARDQARCGNDPDMTPNNFQNEIFNDALSDLMSRYFVNTWSVCNRHDSHSFPTGADIGNMWCNLAKQSHDHNLNSIHVAMASTAIYLTTHMGIAVSALVQADACGATSLRHLEKTDWLLAEITGHCMMALIHFCQNT